MRKSRYTVIPFLLLIVVVFVASQFSVVDGTERMQVSAGSTACDAERVPPSADRSRTRKATFVGFIEAI